MTKPPDPTRRDFLLKLARTAAFVPPAMATLAVRPLVGQGKASATGDTKGAGTAVGQTTVGAISPTAQLIDNSVFDTEPRGTREPWAPREPSQPPPWSRPPPTQTGR
jgi:hypothetical protein